MPSAAERELAGFIRKYTPAVAKQIRAALRRMRKRLPGAVELVYDNYNALAIGFGPSEKAGEVVFSIAAYPRWVSLFFFNAAALPDPARLLAGSGASARHIVLDPPELFDDPAVEALMAESLRRAKVTWPGGRGRVVIKSISAKQRPRRPAGA